MSEVLHADRSYRVVTACPGCGEVEVIPVALGSRLETTRAGSQVSINMKAGKVDHECRQTRIPVPGHGPDPAPEQGAGGGQLQGQGEAW